MREDCTVTAASTVKKSKARKNGVGSSGGCKNGIQTLTPSNRCCPADALSAPSGSKAAGSTASQSGAATTATNMASTLTQSKLVLSK